MTTGNPLIDAHVHLYPDRSSGQQAKADYRIWEYGDDPGVTFSDSAGDLDELRRIYGQGGFDRAVVVQLFDTAAERRRALERLVPPGSPAQQTAARAVVEDELRAASVGANRWLMDAAAATPMVVPFVGVDPTLLNALQIREHLGDMAAAGARGVKLHPVAQRCAPGDPRLEAVYEACCALGLILLSHSGPGHRGEAGARPSEFAAVMNRWPDLRLILAHLGGATWSESVTLAEAYPTILFDLSEIIEWDGAANAPTSADLAGVIRRIGVDRVMLGSDYPWYDPARTADRVTSLPGLGPAETAALLGGTAAAALDLDRAS